MTTFHVLCAGAVKAALSGLIPGFEKRSGVVPDFTYGPVGTLRQKFVTEAAAGALILNRPTLEQLAAQGLVERASIRDIGHVGVGITVSRHGIPPDVSTEAALRRALLHAASLSYGDPAHGDSSGTHFSSVLEKLGIAAQVRAKTHLAGSGMEVVELVGRGAVELGATQSSVILASDQVLLAGLLPPDLQCLTTYAMAPVPHGGPSAQAFVDHLSEPAARAHFMKAGFMPTDERAA